MAIDATISDLYGPRGRAVVNSYRRKYTDRSVEKLATEWADSTVKMEQFYHSFPESDRALVSYERLTTNPAATVRALCEQLEMPFEDGMLEYWRHEHHLLYGNAGTRSLIQKYRGQATGYADHAFYAETGLDIQPDFRWRQELDAQQLAEFERVAGERNRPYAFDEDMADLGEPESA